MPLPQLLSVAPIDRKGVLYLYGVDRRGDVWTWNSKDDEWTPLHEAARRGIALAAPAPPEAA